MNTDNSIQKYEIFLRPCDISMQKILQYQYSIKEYLINGPSMGPHMTLFGFYSYNTLENRIGISLDEFDYTPRPIMIKEIQVYDGRAVITLDKDDCLVRLHNHVLSFFKPEIVFKDYGLSIYEAPEGLFSERYPYVGENYNPHISLGKIKEYVPELSDKFNAAGIYEVGFNKMMIAVKNDKETRYVAEKTF